MESDNWKWLDKKEIEAETERRFLLWRDGPRMCIYGSHEDIQNAHNNMRKIIRTSVVKDMNERALLETVAEMKDYLQRKSQDEQARQ